MKRKANFKVLAVMVSLVLLVGTAADGTLAFLFTSSGSVNNTFKAGHVGCVVSDVDEDSFTIGPDKNTNTDVFLRAAVVANWVDKAGNVYWKAPTVTLDDENWNADGGYFYYNTKVPYNPKTPSVTCHFKVAGAKPEGYDLQIQVLGEAIQADGMGASSAVDAWAKAQTLPDNG